MRNCVLFAIRESVESGTVSGAEGRMKLISTKS